MAGFTNYPFRQIVREFGGAGLQATEMVHAKGFLWIEKNEELPDRTRHFRGVLRTFLRSGERRVPRARI